ncbi:hypothetical protein PU02_1164 [Bartonella ancashensis]|uniref:Uncharacterized protein n=1 Tax=Bartonella ancashensis TaxID=1318743 RepID=A0A0M5KTY0_9HYPH|nr:hypothetical protein PU02_1164 [Bartonella ancashensis]
MILASRVFALGCLELQKRPFFFGYHPKRQVAGALRQDQ